jgi:hypothetical protein
VRATPLEEPGPVDQRRHQPAPTPTSRSTSEADPHTNWTERRGPVNINWPPGRFGSIYPSPGFNAWRSAYWIQRAADFR